MKHFNLLAQWMLCLAILVFAVPYAAAATADTPDAYAYCHFSRAFECQLIHFIGSQPEWRPLVEAATQKFDSEYPKFRENPAVPRELIGAVDMALDKVRQVKNKQEISSKDLLEIVRYEFEAILISFWIDPKLEEPEVAISIFMYFDPAELESFLKFVPERVYRQLKKDSSGTLYSFSLPDGKTLYAGFTHLANRDDYVLALSERRNRVEQQLAFAKSGEFLKTVLQTSGPFDFMQLTPALFEKSREKALQEIKSRSNSDPNAQQVIKVLENLESISLTTEDTAGSTITTLSVTMKNEDDAKNLKETAEGLMALLKMLAAYSQDIDENGKKAIGLATQIKFEQNARTIIASLNYNTPEIENAIKTLLAKALEEVRK